VDVPGTGDHRLRELGIPAESLIKQDERRKAA
jgi:hypothetical protein